MCQGPDHVSPLVINLARKEIYHVVLGDKFDPKEFLVVIFASCFGLNLDQRVLFLAIRVRCHSDAVAGQDFNSLLLVFPFMFLWATHGVHLSLRYGALTTSIVH